MRALENVIAIVLVVIFLVLVPACVNIRICGNNLELCATESIDDKLADINQTGIITLDQYFALMSVLYSCGYRDGLRITEYCYEDGMDGKTYQYSVSFEEICDEIENNGSYRFKSGSYVHMQVPGYSPDNLLMRILYSRRSINKSIKIRQDGAV